jgi:hypothetical protein
MEVSMNIQDAAPQLAWMDGNVCQEDTRQPFSYGDAFKEPETSDGSHVIPIPSDQPLPAR